ncbi:MAG: hypothetical protein ACK55I_29740, partial [bacterium]
ESSDHTVAGGNVDHQLRRPVFEPRLLGPVDRAVVYDNDGGPVAFDAPLCFALEISVGRRVVDVKIVFVAGSVRHEVDRRSVGIDQNEFPGGGVSEDRVAQSLHRFCLTGWKKDVHAVERAELHG